VQTSGRTVMRVNFMRSNYTPRLQAGPLARQGEVPDQTKTSTGIMKRRKNLAKTLQTVSLAAAAKPTRRRRRRFGYACPSREPAAQEPEGPLSPRDLPFIDVFHSGARLGSAVSRASPRAGSRRSERR
jgi:hypothetical protein